MTLISAEPSSPLSVVVMAITSDAVNISWSLPSNSSCIDYYTVRVENGSMMRNLTTDATSIIIDELGKGVTYSFSVRGVDVGGRKGTISETVTLTMDGIGREIILWPFIILL